MTNDLSIEVVVQPSQKDAYQANVAITWGRHKLYYWLIYVASVAFLSGLLFKLISPGTAQDSRLWPSLLFGILFAPIFLVTIVYWSCHRAAKSLLRNTPALRGPTRWTFSETGITTEGPTARAELQWQSLLRVRETKQQFLLYPQKNLACFISKRFISSEVEIDELRELIRRHVPTASLRPRSK
jgi:YcxB-like protein